MRDWVLVWEPVLDLVSGSVQAPVQKADWAGIPREVQSVKTRRHHLHHRRRRR